MAEGKQDAETPVVSLRTPEDLPKHRRQNDKPDSITSSTQITTEPQFLEEATDSTDQIEADNVKELIWREATPVLPRSKSLKRPGEDIPLSSINLFNLGLSWESLRSLGSAVSELTGDYVSKQDLTDLNPPEELYSFFTNGN